MSAALLLILLPWLVVVAAIDFAYAAARLTRVAGDHAAALTQGTVVGTESLGVRSLTLTKRERRYLVRYRFATADGKTMGGTDAILAGHHPQPGTDLEISYDRSDPGHNRIHEKLETGEALFHAVVGGAIVAVALFLVGLGISTWRVERAIRASGTVKLDATVLDIKHDDTSATVTVAFTDPHGSSRRAEDDLTAKEAEALKIGDRGKIWWDPHDPKDISWIG